MTINVSGSESQNPLRRKLRLICILDSCQSAGLDPAHVSVVHSIAYLADALAPVWGLPILDEKVLKRQRRPYFTAMQHNLDELVGQGLVEVVRHSYEVLANPRYPWSIDADYILVSALAQPILDSANQFFEQSNLREFLREITYAVSGLPESTIRNIDLVDATYTDPRVGFGNVISMRLEDGTINRTAKVALRFRQLGPDASNLMKSELVHLYVRHLYSLAEVA